MSPVIAFLAQVASAASPIRAGTVWTFDERVTVVVRPLVGLAVAVFIYWVVRRNPWPRPFRLRFAALHVFVALATVLGWIGISRLIEAIFLGWGRSVPYESEFMVFGSVAYAVVAGISYSVESTARAARAEAAAAHTQLAALRTQLHPHFLFNALHTVVQLIPANPAQAMEAAELLAQLLRSSLDEQRDELPLAEEWAFVSRYLCMERMRFGDRLVILDNLSDAPLRAMVPSFALQTLVENAVRHGAAPRVSPTSITIEAQLTGAVLTLVVRNEAEPAPSDDSPTVSPVDLRSGTGLSRLAERLAVLHGPVATLQYGRIAGGYEAVLRLPQRRGVLA